MALSNESRPLKVGERVKILNSGYTKPGRVVEFRGPLGPGGARIYRVRLHGKPNPAYAEFREDQLEVIRPHESTVEVGPVGHGINRLFTTANFDRVDELGFLDLDRTPQLLKVETILTQPIAWVLGAPWLGKSRVATKIESWLSTQWHVLGGVADRSCLSRLGLPNVYDEIPPNWWTDWCDHEPAQPAVWLLDGVDEGLDRNRHLFERILREIDRASDDHLRQLRLILFTRPHAELGEFRDQLQERYEGITLRSAPPQFWLSRLDQVSAAELVGPDHFPHVIEVIRRNNLQSVAGYPVVLQYLARYSEIANLTVSQVWRGILISLLGERLTNPRARFETEEAERFEVACRIAAVLTLSRCEAIREFSPDATVPTIGTLFQRPDNRPLAAARDACQTAAFVALPEHGAFRFAQRNVQDWLAAFALERLPLPTLRTALVGPDGSLIARLRESSRLIRTITERSEVGTEIERAGGGVLLPSDATEPTLAEALKYLDKLEELAASTPWGVRLGFDRQKELARLKVDGLGVKLAERLRDPTRPYPVKSLLVDVSEATYSVEAVDAAIELVLDPKQHDELRYEAMWLVRNLGGDGHLRALEASIGEATGDSDIEGRLRGVLILRLVDRGLWPLWRAALNAPRVNDDLGDSRGLLLHHLAEKLALDDARQLLPHLRTLHERHADEHRSHHLPKFLDRAVELVTNQDPPNLQDVEHLVSFALETTDESTGWAIARDIGTRLRPFAIARRRLYEHDVEMTRQGKNDRRIFAFHLLMPDDWRWLRDQALGPWSGVENVWINTYLQARLAHENQQIAEPEWQEFVALVEQHVPDLPTRIEAEAARRKLERDRDEARQKRRERQDPTRRPLADRVAKILDDAMIPVDDRMRSLGFLCFSRIVGLDPQAQGGWNELQPGLQLRVLDACRLGLEVGKPTAIPRQQSFPSTILAEGAAFSQVVHSLGNTGWLSDTLIRRWLPTGLLARIGDWTELIRSCWAASPTATEQVLIATIADQVERFEQAHNLRTIPSECWTDGMTHQVLKFLQDSTIPPKGRRELLEQLALRSPEQADPIATEWAARPVATDDSDQLRQAGRNVLLFRDPTAALNLIEPDVAGRGTAALEELSIMWGWRDESHVRWETWAMPLLERLATILIRVFPPSNDPEFKGGFVPPDHELRQIRDRLINLLLQRSDAETQAVVDRLAKLDQKVAAWVKTHRATERANELIPTFDPTNSSDTNVMTVSEAVRVLDRANYRLIRSTEDLLDAIVETLRQINQDVGQDLPLLYEAPKNQQPRGHLHEDALQAYLRRRLLDLLPRIVDDVDVQIVREDQVGYRQRLDIRVTAPCHGTRHLATVVVEVKWSTNKDTRTGLAEQLGDRYLLREGLTHGVFLVGWSGQWYPGDGTGEDENRVRLEQFLSNQRDTFCKTGQPGESLRIEPVVLDLRWSQTRPQ